jgi:hypothetical protein
VAIRDTIKARQEWSQWGFNITYHLAMVLQTAGVDSFSAFALKEKNERSRINAEE